MEKHKLHFFICLFGGIFGIHKFYEKKVGIGLLYLFTAGLFFIGWISDSISLYRVAYILSPEEVTVLDKKDADDMALRAEKVKERRAVALQKRNERLRQYKADQEAEANRLAQLRKEHTPYCPRCHSTSITYVEERKKLSVGRAVVGGIIAGETGAVLGGLSSKKVKGHVKCLNCGHTWKI